jgi:uncharacterized protein YkwD
LTWAVPLAASLVVAATGEAATLSQSEASLLSVMNEARRVHGLRPLRLDPRLEDAARRHSRKMLHTNTFFHGRFDLRIRGAGVSAPVIGENLAWATGGVALARAVVQMWLRSPAHRANLLRPGYQTVGIAAPLGPFAGCPLAYVVTADFAGR